MQSNSLPDADLNLPEMKTKSPSCPSGGVHMYGIMNLVSLLPSERIAQADLSLLDTYLKGVLSLDTPISGF